MFIVVTQNNCLNEMVLSSSQKGKFSQMDKKMITIYTKKIALINKFGTMLKVGFNLYHMYRNTLSDYLSNTYVLASAVRHMHNEYYLPSLARNLIGL